METIVLEPGLRTWLEQDAAQDVRSLNDLVNEAVGRYLRERQQTKLDREIAAYEAMHPRLLREHLDEWVAIHRQKLVDHDGDCAALYRRVRAQYDRTSVLIRQVTPDPIEEVWMHTPTTGKARR